MGIDAEYSHGLEHMEDTRSPVNGVHEPSMIEAERPSLVK